MKRLLVALIVFVGVSSGQSLRLDGKALGDFVPDGVAFIGARKLDGSAFIIRVETHRREGRIVQEEDCFLDWCVWGTVNEEIWENVPHFRIKMLLGGRHVRSQSPFILRIIDKPKEQRDGEC